MSAFEVLFLPKINFSKISPVFCGITGVSLCVLSMDSEILRYLDYQSNVSKIRSRIVNVLVSQI